MICDYTHYAIGLLAIIVIYLLFRDTKRMEHMSDISGVNLEALHNLSSMYNSGTLKITNLEVTGKTTLNDEVVINNKLTVGGDTTLKNNIEIGKNAKINGSSETVGNSVVNGKLNVNNGSEFKGGRHYFSDEENAGRLRVGAAWGNPGIYAEDGKNILIGSSSRNIYLGGPNDINNSGIVRVGTWHIQQGLPRSLKFGNSYGYDVYFTELHENGKHPAIIGYRHNTDQWGAVGWANLPHWQGPKG